MSDLNMQAAGPFNISRGSNYETMLNSRLDPTDVMGPMVDLRFLLLFTKAPSMATMGLTKESLKNLWVY